MYIHLYRRVHVLEKQTDVCENLLLFAANTKNELFDFLEDGVLNIVLAEFSNTNHF